MPFLLLEVQESVSFNFRDISDRKVWKSIREASCSPSPPIHSWSSCSVGFCPSELNKVPNSWGAKVGDPTWNKHRDFKILNPTGLQGEPVVLVLVKELEGVIELLDLLRLHWIVKMRGLHGTSRPKLKKHAACPILSSFWFEVFRKTCARAKCLQTTILVCLKNWRPSNPWIVSYYTDALELTLQAPIFETCTT